MIMLKKFNLLPQGAKASAAFFFANVVTKGISYLTLPIYTRLLTSEEYGQVSIFLTYVQLFGIVAMFCLSYGVFNVGMSSYPDKRDKYSLSMLMLSNVITVCFSAVFLILFPVAKQWFKLPLSLAFVMFALFFFQPAYNFWLTRQRYELRYKWSVFWAILIPFSSTLICILCILIIRGSSRLYPRILGVEIPQILIYIGFYVYLFRQGGFHVSTRYWKEAFLFNLPLIPHYLSSYLLGSADKIMISHYIGDTATAYYTVAYAVAVVANILWTAANSSLIPYTYENCKVRNFKAINQVVMPLLFLFAGACVMVILFAPEVVTIMARRDYAEAIYVIPPIVGGTFFQVLYFIFANVVYYYKKPVYVMVGSGIAVLLNLILNAVFIPLYGYAAAAYTTLFCYAVQAAFDYFAMKWVEREEIYNLKVLVPLCLGMTVFSIFSTFLYSLPIVRYVIIFAMIAVLFITRKRVMKYYGALLKSENRRIK